MIDKSTSECRLTSVSFGRRVRRWYYRRIIRLFTLLHSIALVMAKMFGYPLRQPRNGEGYSILLTGSFYSSNWVLSYLRPLAASKACSHITMVSSSLVPTLPKVDAVYPPKWLIRIVGTKPARLFVFISTAVRKRPNIVGGYHLFPNGLVASVVAPIVGARSLYHCVGGPVEALDGGIHVEAGAFAKMEIPDLVVERRLLRAVAACDLVLTMGTKAIDFFQSKGVRTNFHVVSASVDFEQFAPAESPPCYDLIFVGRLVEIKRIDIFLQALQLVRKAIPNVTAVIVGEGPLRSELERLARDLGIDDCVAFVGKQRNVAEWLNKARVFVLTSRSEGLSIAMTEAMVCGLPPVVPDVGDLADLVDNGVNGYLIRSRSPEAFASRMVELLTDHQKRAKFSKEARSAATHHGTEAIARKWDRILTDNHKATAAGI